MPKPTALLKGFEKQVRTAKPTGKRQVIFDNATTGLALIVSPKGKRSFSIVARDPAGKQVWKRIGDPALMEVAEAREEAAQAVARVKNGMNPLGEPQKAPETFRDVCETFMARHVEAKSLKMHSEVRRTMDVYVLPEWGDLPFADIRRRTVTDLLDKIEDRKAGATGNLGGPSQADHTLSYLSKLFAWHQARDEDYVSPIVRGMKRTNPRETARARILSDEEIRTIWGACEKVGTYGALVQTALLTAQRRAKVATMRWQDISDGIWTIPAEAREKTNAGILRLPKLALDIINAQPEVKGNPYVFAGRGKAAFNSHSVCKKRLDKFAPIEPWVFHDLRRTARSLMSRAGVRPDHAERALGHAIIGVEGIYDRHSYLEEKGAALAALASLVERILQGEMENVTPIWKAAQ